MGKKSRALREAVKEGKKKTTGPSGGYSAPMPKKMKKGKKRG